MASAEKLPSGRYRGMWRDAARRKHYTKPYARKTDARERAQEEEVKARRQAASTGGPISAKATWSQWADSWWPTRNLEIDTADVENRIRNGFLGDEWGGTPLNQISRRNVQAWVNRLAKKHSAGYVGRIYTSFRASILAAVEEEVLLASPCVGIKLPVVPKTARRHFEQEELDAFLPLLRKRHRQAAEFLLDTGLRPGEFAGLHRDHVHGGWITVADVLIDKGRAIKPKPKDEDSREVPLTTRALDLLSEWAEAIPARSGCGLVHTNGKRCRSDLVFRQLNGSPLSLTSFRDVLGRAVEKAGLRHATLYDLRHTYGTRLAEHAVDAHEIARLMGHADVNQSSAYVHRTASARLRVLAALGDPAAAELKIVGRGADHGADLGNQPPRPTPSETRSNSA